MPIIGKLLKKTTELSYKRNFNKGKEYENQLHTLTDLLTRAKNTSFGFRYDFTTVLSSTDMVEAYQQQVPMTDYDKFYEQWLVGSIQGIKDHTWPGRIKFYALSSGTTGSPSKRIPVTEQMIRSFQKTSMRQISTLHELDLPDSFFSASILAVGGSAKLTKKSTHVEGDLSGILKKYTSFVVNPFTKPENRIAGIKDWNKKLDLMVERAPHWNIGIIAGVPSWCIMLMERVIERYQLNTIHDIWPNLSVYVHGGVFIDPYTEKLQKLFSKPVHQLDTYLASEGYFAYQTSPDRKGMQLLLNTGVFYEFVPFTSEFFDEEGNLRDENKAFTLSEVTEGVDYAIVISTNAGLWRYMIGDLVRFIDVEERVIKITGRIKQFMSLVGEHLSLDNINTAVQQAAKNRGISVPEYCLYADQENQRHIWFFGCNSDLSAQDFMDEVDQALKDLNDDYAAVRKYSLNNPIPKVIPVSYFYEYMEFIGKAGSQNKVPRVMNNHQRDRLTEFLSTKSAR